jgi:hypothetical protein
MERRSQILIWRFSMKHIAQHEIVGITKAEFDALVWVRDELASGRIKHAPKGASYGGFNMSCYSDQRDCGTAHCIGGFMWQRMGTDRTKTDYPRQSGTTALSILSVLFHPTCVSSYDKITPTQAVRAIDNFLFNSPGKPQWVWVETVKA